MKKTKLFGWALFASMISLSACSNDAEEVFAQENEIKLTSEITPSRVTSLDYQSTQIVKGQQVGVTITGAKSEHKNVAWNVGEEGELSNTGDPVYYGDGAATITAYHPFNDDWDENTSYAFSVNTDQSSEENYRNSDLLWAAATSSKTETAIPLIFSHKLAKINVTLKSEDIEDLSGATINICGTNITTNFNPVDGTLSAATANIQEIKAGVTSSTAYTASAIVVPQTVANGTKFIKITHNDRTFYYTLSTNKELKSGCSHNYTLTIKEKEVTTESDKITDWEDDDNIGDAEEIEPTIPNNQIWYTSSDGSSITPYMANAFGANIVSNVYENKKGIITFDGDVTMIGNYAFNSRRSLVSISIPNSVTTIGDGAFKTCTSLTNMTISNNVTAIGESAFESCNSLTNITIPNSVTTIEDRTFYSCYKLDNISIPNDVTSIGKQAFSGCETLTSITIPASVTTIGEKAFTYCRSLANIIVNEENLFYDSRENCNAIINTASNTLISGCKNTIIPNSVTIIGKGAFQACYDMVDITIPNSVTTIGEDAFDNCSSLTDITIPNSVTTIGDRAFAGCSSLSRVNIKAITPPATGVYIFQNCSSNIEFYVPAESLETYKATDYWKDLNLLSASEDWFNPNQYITYVKNHEWVYVGSKNYYQYSSYINCPVKNISKIEFKYKLTDFNLSHYVYLCSNNIAADKTSSIYLSKDDGLVIKNENWNEDDGWILNSTVNYSWNELNVDMTDCMTLVASFKNKYIHLNNVELEYKISKYTSFESKYLFTYYTHENDEGIWCVLGEGVPEGSKLYYVKIWDENDDIVYLGAASKAMNPTTNKEEYCWKSYYNGEYNYEFAYYPTTHSDYTPYGGGID